MSGQFDQPFFQSNYSLDMGGMGAPGASGDSYGAPPAQYDYNQPYASYAAGTSEVPYTGTIMQPEEPAGQPSGSTTSFEDEPPLLEELGINFDHIYQKTLSVLNPTKPTDPHIMDDTDLAGPLVFCILLGGFLLLSGKVHFGYIYGVGLVGSLCMYALLNLMSMTGVGASTIISVLGYCLLPMVFLASINVFLSLQGMLGIILTVIVILWCSVSASKLFVTALAMDSQQPLVAYPCALLYGVFALLTVF